MPNETCPRTVEAALAEARRLADRGRPQAKALFTSGYHDAGEQLAWPFSGQPWCDGAVWSMNSMPGIKGEVTDFTNKWNARLRDGCTARIARETSTASMSIPARAT